MTDQDPVAVFGGPEKAREWLSDGIRHWHCGESTYDRYVTASLRLAITGLDAAALKAENEKLSKQLLAMGLERERDCRTMLAENEKLRAELDAALGRAAEELRRVRGFVVPYVPGPFTKESVLACIDRRLAALEAKPSAEPVIFDEAVEPMTEEQWAKIRPMIVKPVAFVGTPKRPGEMSMIQCDDDGLRELREMVACDQSVGAFGDASLDTVRKLALMLADRALGGGK